MKRILLTTLSLCLFSVNAAFAQTAFEIAPNANYQARGNASVNVDGSRYRITAKVDNLPATIPNSGRYYILWATIEDGRADNLGTITNGQEVSTTVVGRPKQIFITAEKDRFPEYVQGPRLSQTKEFAANEIGALPSPTAVPSGSVLPVGGGNVGQPNEVPETGLGGSLLFSAVTAGMIVFGSFGALQTLAKSSKK